MSDPGIIQPGTCRSCPFLKRPLRAEEKPQCRAVSPKAWVFPMVGPAGQMMGGSVLTSFPETSLDDWCGEHPWRKIQAERQAAAYRANAAEFQVSASMSPEAVTRMVAPADALSGLPSITERVGD